MNLTNTWWALPSWIQAAIKPLTKMKSSWTMPCYKSEGKDWKMNIPMLLTWGETLTGGTEKALDWWYESLSGEKPEAGSTIKLTLSKTPTPSYTTKLILEPTEMHSCWTDGDDSYWWEPISKTTCWLCPYLPWLMGGIPKKLYVTMELAK